VGASWVNSLWKNPSILAMGGSWDGLFRRADYFVWCTTSRKSMPIMAKGGVGWLDRGIIGGIQFCFFEQDVLLA
jgi:hypothetical protein